MRRTFEQFLNEAGKVAEDTSEEIREWLNDRVSYWQNRVDELQKIYKSTEGKAPFRTVIANFYSKLMELYHQLGHQPEGTNPALIQEVITLADVVRSKSNEWGLDRLDTQFVDTYIYQMTGALRDISNFLMQLRTAAVPGAAAAAAAEVPAAPPTIPSLPTPARVSATPGLPVPGRAPR